MDKNEDRHFIGKMGTGTLSLYQNIGKMGTDTLLIQKKITQVSNFIKIPIM